MNTITLSDSDAVHLAQHGRVLVIEPAPTVTWDAEAEWFEFQLPDGTFAASDTEVGIIARLATEFTPHQPGDVVVITAPGTLEVHDDGMTEIAPYFPATVVSVRARRLHDLIDQNDDPFNCSLVVWAIELERKP